MRVMVIGSGGREHALVKKIDASPEVEEIVALPGSDAMAGTARIIDPGGLEVEAIVGAAGRTDVDLVVVGPEKPLADGLVDALRREGIPAFGPTGDAARIESSKVFAKDLMQKYRIPTADFKVFDCYDEAARHLGERPLPVVLKADGLAAGKGVVVARDREEALQALEQIMLERRFGDAGRRVVIEDCLVGEEVSVMAITDGETLVPLAEAQDHKAVYDGDEGPNTGGMGVFSPVPVYDADLARQVEDGILGAAVRAMRAEGIFFSGVLYAGLMITEDGPQVLEFNCRFGDPETQVVLPRMKNDLLPLLVACARGDGSLAREAAPVRWSEQSAVCVVLASGGYPLQYETGQVIRGLDGIDDDVEVYHAGTARVEGDWVTAGGRVLGVTGMGEDLEGARERAYSAIQRVEFDGMHYRRDIGRSRT